MNNKLLRFLRQSKGLTQSELADRLQVTQSMINQYEKGKKPIPHERVKQLYEIFGDDYITQANEFLRGTIK